MSSEESIVSLFHSDNEMADMPKPKKPSLSPGTQAIDPKSKVTPVRKRAYTKRKPAPAPEPMQLPSVSQAVDFLKQTFSDGSMMLIIIPAVNTQNTGKK